MVIGTINSNETALTIIYDNALQHDILLSFHRGAKFYTNETVQLLTMRVLSEVDEQGS